MLLPALNPNFLFWFPSDGRSTLKIKLVAFRRRTLMAAVFSLALAEPVSSVALAQGNSVPKSEAMVQDGSLAEAYRIIASKQFVDLSKHQLNQ